MLVRRCHDCGSMWTTMSGHLIHVGPHHDSCKHQRVEEGRARMCCHSGKNNPADEQDCKRCQRAKRRNPATQPWLLPMQFDTPLFIQACSA